MAGAFKLTNDTLLLSTEAPGGIYNSTQLKKIAALCDAEGAIVKATEDQRLALFVPAAKAGDISKQLQSVGVGTRHYQDGLHQPTNCVGALCPDHLQDAMGAALEVTEAFAKTKTEAACKIGLNGCSRCCVPTHTLDISVIGDTNGYRISLGGKNSQLPEIATFMAEGVPAAELPKLLSKVVGIYKKLAEAEESLQDVIERCGAKLFVEALAPYSQDAHQSDHDAGSGGFDGIIAEADRSDIEPMPPTAANMDLNAASLNVDDISDDLSEDNADLNTFGDVAAINKIDDSLDESLDAFDTDLNPQAELAVKSTGVDIDPGQFGDSDLLDDDVTIGTAVLEDSNFDQFSEPLASAVAGRDEPLPDSLDELTDLSMDSLDARGVATDGAIPDDALVMEQAANDSAFDDAAVSDDILMLENEALDESLAAGAGLDDDQAIGSSSDDTMNDVVSATNNRTDELALDTGAAEFSADDLAGDLVMESTQESPVQAAQPPLKAAAAAPPPASEPIDEFALAEEVAEDEVDAFEAKLEESIAEEESIPQAEDLNAGARLEAMELVEASSDDEVAADINDLNQDTAEEFSDLGIDEENFETLGEGDVDYDAASMEGAEKPAPLEPNIKPAKVAQFNQKLSTESAALTGFDLDSSGRLIVRFSSGVALTVDAAAVGRQRRELMACGQKIVISQNSSGLCVEVDGVAMILPQAA